MGQSKIDCTFRSTFKHILSETLITCLTIVFSSIVQVPSPLMCRCLYCDMETADHMLGLLSHVNLFEHMWKLLQEPLCSSVTDFNWFRQKSLHQYQYIKFTIEIDYSKVSHKFKSLKNVWPFPSSLTDLTLYLYYVFVFYTWVIHHEPQIASLIIGSFVTKSSLSLIHRFKGNML